MKVKPDLQLYLENAFVRSLILILLRVKIKFILLLMSSKVRRLRLVRLVGKFVKLTTFLIVIL